MSTFFLSMLAAAAFVALVVREYLWHSRFSALDRAGMQLGLTNEALRRENELLRSVGATDTLLLEHTEPYVSGRGPDNAAYLAKRRVGSYAAEAAMVTHDGTSAKALLLLSPLHDKSAIGEVEHG